MKTGKPVVPVILVDHSSNAKEYKWIHKVLDKLPKENVILWNHHGRSETNVNPRGRFAPEDAPQGYNIILSAQRQIGSSETAVYFDLTGFNRGKDLYYIHDANALEHWIRKVQDGIVNNLIIKHFKCLYGVQKRRFAPNGTYVVYGTELSQHPRVYADGVEIIDVKLDNESSYIDNYEEIVRRRKNEKEFSFDMMLMKDKCEDRLCDFIESYGRRGSKKRSLATDETRLHTYDSKRRRLEYPDGYLDDLIKRIYE